MVFVNFRNSRLISEFEREAFKQRFREELHDIREVRGLLGDRDLRVQKSFELEKDLESRLKQLEVHRKIQVLHLRLREMKFLKRKLDQRLVQKRKDGGKKLKIYFLARKLGDEIYREECGLNEGFASFLFTASEIKILEKI